jgi:hypothetical protein
MPVFLDSCSDVYKGIANIDGKEYLGIYLGGKYADVKYTKTATNSKEVKIIQVM